jgi:hypothetical protein
VEVQARADGPNASNRDVLPTSATHRLLADLMWIELVMCRPLLVPAADPSEVLRHVEALAGHVADLLASEGRELPPDNSVVATAQEALDVCCRFIERWNGRAAWDEEFDVDARRLRTRLDQVMQHLAFESLGAQRKAS